VVAWWVPEGAGPSSRFRVVGSHTDSPSLKLKPQPHSRAYGFSQVDVEPYGGLVPNAWLNRDLGVAGRLICADGAERLFSTGEPVMFVPQLAPHLHREDALTLDRQRHLHPVWATGDRSILGRIAQAAGAAPGDVVGMDAYAYDTQAPAVVGSEFLAAQRQDNLVSVHASLTALLAADSREIAVLAAFDHEEVGSSTTTGANGPLLERVLQRTALALGASWDEYFRMLAGSSCVSADAGHSVNPNYPEYYEPCHYPVAGGGPVVKLNANQRYASDGPGQALWLRACRRAGQPTQEFVSNNAVPCGSTIGPSTATRLGIDTVDVGVPLLSMHSVREVSHLRDSWALAAILRGYWELD
jgi:probable M18 family aminopeptidase 2